MGDRNAQVRDEAYRMWVDAGRPDGGDQHYWFEAEKRVVASDATGEKAAKAKKVPKPAKEAAHKQAAPKQAPDVEASKVAGAGQKAAAKPPEGAKAVPSPGLAEAKRTPTVKVVAKNAGNSGVASPAATPKKGERVEVAPLKTPIRAPRKSPSKPK